MSILCNKSCLQEQLLEKKSVGAEKFSSKPIPQNVQISDQKYLFGKWVDQNNFSVHSRACSTRIYIIE